MTAAGGFEVTLEDLRVRDALVEDQGIDDRQAAAARCHEGEQECGKQPPEAVPGHI